MAIQIAHHLFSVLVIQYNDIDMIAISFWYFFILRCFQVQFCAIYQVSCRDANHHTYEGVHLGVAFKPSLHKRGDETTLPSSNMGGYDIAIFGGFVYGFVITEYHIGHGSGMFCNVVDAFSQLYICYQKGVSITKKKRFTFRYKAMKQTSCFTPECLL